MGYQHYGYTSIRHDLPEIYTLWIYSDRESRTASASRDIGTQRLRAFGGERGITVTREYTDSSILGTTRDSHLLDPGVQGAILCCYVSCPTGRQTVKLIMRESNH